MDVEEYVEHKGVELIDDNPNRRNSTMANRKTKPQLEAELDEANDYIEELEEKLDDIVGIAADEEEDSDEEDDEEDEELD